MQAMGDVLEWLQLRIHTRIALRYDSRMMDEQQKMVTVCRALSLPEWFEPWWEEEQRKAEAIPFPLTEAAILVARNRGELDIGTVREPSSHSMDMGHMFQRLSIALAKSHLSQFVSRLRSLLDHAS